MQHRGSIRFAAVVLTALLGSSCGGSDPAPPWDEREMLRELPSELRRYEGLTADFDPAEILAWRVNQRAVRDRVEIVLLWGRPSPAGAPAYWAIVQGFRRPDDENRWQRSLRFRELMAPLTDPRPGEDSYGTWHAFQRYDRPPTVAEICEFAAVDLFATEAESVGYRRVAGELGERRGSVRPVKDLAAVFSSDTCDMTSKPHGFTRVDDEPRPADWVACLDAMHREPFYRAYKARVREILAPQPSGLYLEVGAGAGTDALALGAPVVAVDRSLTMCREARRRGLARVAAADAGSLPVPGASVDGCWADRTFQHLASPRRALEELTRVMKPGATLVVVDPDYGTQAMPFPDETLARRVFDFRARHLLRNGRLAHEMGAWFASGGFERVSVEERRLVVRDPAAVDNVMGLRSWAGTARDRGLMPADDAARWETLYDRVVERGELEWSVSFFMVSGRKPAALPSRP